MACIAGQTARPAAVARQTSQRAAARAFGSRPRPAAQAARRAAGRAAQQQRLVARASSQNVSAEPAGPVNDDTFKELVLESDVPVLVDFWAPWCGPCRMIAPIVDELATEFEGKIKAYKLNTDESPRVAAEYGIRSIPTVMFFKDGQKMDTVIGAVPKSTLQQNVEKFL